MILQTCQDKLLFCQHTDSWHPDSNHLHTPSLFWKCINEIYFYNLFLFTYDSSMQLWHPLQPFWNYMFIRIRKYLINWETYTEVSESPDNPKAIYWPSLSLATSCVTMLFPAMAHLTSYPMLSSSTSQLSFDWGSIPSILRDGGTFRFLGILTLPKST